MKALLIEDYKPLRTSVAKAIHELGWAVDVGVDGEEGQWFMDHHAYDVIILDLMLPKVQGLELLRHLRGKGDGTPVIILTAMDAVEDRTRGLDLGADDYLVKPFFLTELMARLKARVRRSYQQPDPTLRVGDLEIDTNARQVQRNGQVMTLTAREYALLEYLARRQGQVVTRTEIWGHVYESYGESASNVVDVYVGYLRRKLHQPGRPQLLQTRRGHGYILQEPK
ncbi:MAG TPA: response regulator transcription factor [Candidatus Dormibacteraeota bacterium]|nr:response regulator transcription factor [Verrucomicrobiae bacterium]HXJ74274.1 response regulator transcription factor [Candidatus Dormibacteraeota bacterium]